MPGSTPPTSQLDWLISTTAMIVLSWSRATRDLLKSFGWGIRALHQLDAATMVPSSPPAPYHLAAGGKGIRTLGPPSGAARPNDEILLVIDQLELAVRRANFVLTAKYKT